MGVERLALLLEGNGITTATPKFFIAAMGCEAENIAFGLLNQLQHHGIYAEMDFSGKSLKAQLRRANKLKCDYTLFLGENELTDGNAQLKRMSDGEQTALPLEGIFEQLCQLLDAPASKSL
jgi:histidyl-tRNA synthetase